MKSLQAQELIDAYDSLCNELERVPGRILTNFDPKIISGDTYKHMEKNSSTVQAAAPEHQNSNGLSERNWQTVTHMSRAWLSSSLLSPAFWWYAIKCAVKTSNYLPVKKGGKLTTPFVLTYHQKPDPRLLFPMFSVAYVCKLKDGKNETKKFQHHSLTCILVGKCPKSDAFVFYNPKSKTEITSIDFTYNSTLPPGPLLSLQYKRFIAINCISHGYKHIAPLYPP
eukprot:11472815-Ditylum_brightwellii.AAC.1